MGLYLPKMEMPEKTYTHCMLIKDIDGSVQLHVCTKNSEEISEWEFFDFVPVPKHGRLIDADEFLKRAIGTKCFRGDYALMLEELVGESTTIIEADRNLQSASGIANNSQVIANNTAEEDET